MSDLHEVFKKIVSDDKFNNFVYEKSVSWGNRKVCLIDWIKYYCHRKARNWPDKSITWEDLAQIALIEVYHAILQDRVETPSECLKIIQNAIVDEFRRAKAQKRMFKSIPFDVILFDEE